MILKNVVCLFFMIMIISIMLWLAEQDACGINSVTRYVRDLFINPASTHDRKPNT